MQRNRTAVCDIKSYSIHMGHVTVKCWTLYMVCLVYMIYRLHSVNHSVNSSSKTVFIILIETTAHHHPLGVGRCKLCAVNST